ncbi:DUF4082 domain-containing protein [Nocardioides currus]|uniref:DUF4082 domain-containing protein n=1 Tax=Nocardioides currus TaxID=2133958 RepID=A0A2R7Z143_9ACTN|nr:DUF4082 domain-containing protein [Nocardioides currus]PUA82348.1 hypothetical protein C7S10_00920 [Nocardioides currus]
MSPSHLRPLAAAVRAALGLVLAAPVLVAATADASPVSTSRAVERADERAGAVTVKEAGRDRERGLRFRPSGASQVTAVRYYRAAGDTVRHVARLWGPDGRELARVSLLPVRKIGWQKVSLGQPVSVSAKPHLLSFGSPAGVPFAVDRTPGTGSGRYRILGGAIGPISQRPAREIKAAFHVRPVLATPTSTAPPTAFPNAANTGAPDTARLAAYNGPVEITKPGTVIDGKLVPTYLMIEAPGVVIKNSYVEGNIVIGDGGGSLTISDSTVDGGTYDGSAVGQYNITMRRVEVIGARQSVSCNENCDIQDSWLHAQYMPAGSDWHGDGFTSNGGHDMLVRHNTLACDSQSDNGGCSSAMALFADFDPLSRVTVDGNFFSAGPAAYCLYGGYDPQKPYGTQSTYMVITNNVFERGANRKCASFGPVTAVAEGGEGNVFSGNVWEDGKKVRGY